jgi:hypothetical protein
VRIALVADVPHDAIAREVEDVVQRAVASSTTRPGSSRGARRSTAPSRAGTGASPRTAAASRSWAGVSGPPASGIVAQQGLQGLRGSGGDGFVHAGPGWQRSRLERARAIEAQVCDLLLVRCKRVF